MFSYEFYVAWNSLKETPTCVFCQLCKNFKNTIFTEHLQVAATEGAGILK